MYTAWYTTSCEKYLNNIIEPIIDLSKTDSEYAWIEILANGYKIIAGIEAMHMIKKDKLSKGRSLSKSKCILSMKYLA